jgi:hypothetical protein
MKDNIYDDDPDFEPSFADGAEGEDEWSQTFDARLAGLEKVLGKADDGVLHAALPLFLGGNADVLIFPGFPGGTAYVTADLTGQDVGQVPNSLGFFELMLCCRAPNSGAAGVISRLARLSLERRLDMGQVLDLSADPSSPFDAVLLAEGMPQPQFRFGGKRWGLLLCVGITDADREFQEQHGASALMEKLEAEDRFPFSTFRPASCLPASFLDRIPQTVRPAEWTGAPAAFVSLLDESLAALRERLSALRNDWGFGAFESWELSQETGVLTFFTPDGGRVECAAQIVGTRQSADGSWEWAWHNPHVAEPLQRDARRVKAYGATHRVPQLTRGRIKVSEAAAWALTALAAKLGEAQGAYCGSVGPTQVFIVFGPPKVSRRKAA